MKNIMTTVIGLSAFITIISLFDGEGSHCRPTSATCKAARAARNSAAVHPGPVVYTLLDGTIYFPDRTTPGFSAACVERIEQWPGGRASMLLLKKSGVLTLKINYQDFIATETIQTIKESGARQFELIGDIVPLVAPDRIKLTISETGSDLSLSLLYDKDVTSEKNELKEKFACDLAAIPIDDAVLSTLWQ
ncbi:hypothetical protein HV213_04040 [Klebsiella sp. RHBSTW-00484]|uniref:hypothetical protein n=1 Tax=unclassified Klebsiella TaxID=2608929 RepID=UPI0015E5599D|nr:MULTISPECIES: hypothetical protein [unclassified Klebsiella]MBA7845175.1 hypothetical protein [Klebsiella sp. RHBSTW-00465]QLO35079.1 hypothetical protein HV213_04040 [Klebsiella sp. RHBSTW-00484]QLT74592.1 hypothetical protein HV204_04040 [Klebsiella sp. RHBSTW-00464]